MQKFLIALPSFIGQKGFNCKTILVSAKNQLDAVSIVNNLRPGVYIGDIKTVDY